jgi:WD40 repeat protein
LFLFNLIVVNFFFFLASGSDDGTVRLWDMNSKNKKCRSVLYGHVTNVFATHFFPHRPSFEVLRLYLQFILCYFLFIYIFSGGNDGVLIHHNAYSGIGTHYLHHTKKIMSVVVNPIYPDSFFSCSFDGTVRLYDVRVPYSDCMFKVDNYNYYYYLSLMVFFF